jgi:hypothetical protein
MANRTTNTVDALFEQLARDNFRHKPNAIDKARSFASLLMAIYRQQGMKFKSFNEVVPEGGCDRSYYAQIADSKVYPIPLEKAELIRDALALNSIKRLERYRALLRLPDETWIAADTQNYPEYRIRFKNERSNIGPRQRKKPSQISEALRLQQLRSRAFDIILAGIETNDPQLRADARFMMRKMREWLNRLDAQMDAFDGLLNPYTDSPTVRERSPD